MGTKKKWVKPGGKLPLWVGGGKWSGRQTKDDFFFQVGRDGLHGLAFPDRAGLIPAFLEGLLLLLLEFLEAGGHGLPDQELLENVTLRGSQFPFRIKGFPCFEGEDH